MLAKNAKTSVPVNEIIASRWSCRAFDINRPVTREQIVSVCEAGRWAPSCRGDEPWRYIVWDLYRNRDAYLKAFDCLDEWNQRWVKNVPVIIGVFADSKFRRGNDNRWGQHDTGAASMNMYLQAVTLGLMAHPMGGFDEVKIKEVFGIPDQFIPMAVIAIGYQADPKVIEDKGQLESELAERNRQPLNNSFFDSEWGKGISE